MANDEYQEGIAGNDIKVVNLLSSLPRVDAPADFGVKVRARILRKIGEGTTGHRLPNALFIASGLGVTLIVLVMIGLAWTYSGDIGSVPAVAVSNKAEVSETPGRSVMPVQPLPEVVEVPTANDRPPSGPDLVIRKSGQTKETNRPRNADSLERSDSALSNSRTIYPQGINPNLKALPSPDTIADGQPIKVKEVLSFLGVDSRFVNDGWLIEAVSTNSTAERFGLKAGDVIIAINEKQVSEDTTFSGSFTGKSLKIVRAGQTIRIVLKDR